MMKLMRPEAPARSDEAAMFSAIPHNVDREHSLIIHFRAPRLVELLEHARSGSLINYLDADLPGA